VRQTALHWAAKRGENRIVKLLLENGADPDARDIVKKTISSIILNLIRVEEHHCFSQQKEAILFP